MQTPEPTAAAGQPATMNPALRVGMRFGALLWICLLAAHLAACGGGGDDPDVGTPRVDCRVEVCK